MRAATPLTKQLAVINLYVQVKRGGGKMVQFEIAAERVIGVCKTVAYAIIRKAKIEGKIKTK